MPARGVRLQLHTETAGPPEGLQQAYSLCRDFGSYPVSGKYDHTMGSRHWPYASAGSSTGAFVRRSQLIILRSRLPTASIGW